MWTSRWRKRYAYGYAEYAIVEALEEAEYLNRLTREEIQYFYKLIGTRAGLLGLLPRRPIVSPDAEMLKGAIQSRIRGSLKVRRRDMHSCTIVHRKVGQQIPNEFRARLLAGVKAIGVAVIDPTEKAVDYLDIMKDHDAQLRDMEEMFKDYDTIYSFQEFPDGELNPDDVQPFVLHENDTVKKPDLVAFMDGGFIGHHHPESAHSNAFFVHHEWLVDEVKEMLNGGASNNFENLISMLEGKRFQKNVQNVCIPRGAILFAAGTGKVVAVQNNNKFDREFDWGWMSKDPFVWDLEHKNTQPEHLPKYEPPKVEEKKLTPMEAFKLKQQMKNTPVQGPIQALTEKPTDTKIVQIDGSTLIAPPAQILKKSQNKVKNWYRYNFGKNVTLPADLSKGLPFARLLDNSPLRKHDSVAAIRKAAEDAIGTDNGDEDETETAPAAAPVTTPATGPKIQATGAAINLISPQLKTKLNEDVLPKFTLLDPSTLPNNDVEVPSVSDFLGYPFEKMVCWDAMSVKEFCRAGNGEAAAMLISELFRDLLSSDTEFRAKVIEALAPKVEKERPLTAMEKFKARKAG